MAQGGNRKQYDHLIKLIIIGDSSVGKSCILLRFSEDNFPLSHMPTIGKFFSPLRNVESTQIGQGIKNVKKKRKTLSDNKVLAENRA